MTRGSGLLLVIACASCQGARGPSSESERRLDFCVLSETKFRNGKVDELRIADNQDDVEQLWQEMRRRTRYPATLTSPAPKIDFQNFFSLLFTRMPDGCRRDIIALAHTPSGVLRVFYSDGDNICMARSDSLVGSLLMVSRVGVTPSKVQSIESSAEILNPEPSKEDALVWRTLCSKVVERSFSDG